MNKNTKVQANLFSRVDIYGDPIYDYRPSYEDLFPNEEIPGERTQ